MCVHIFSVYIYIYIYIVASVTMDIVYVSWGEFVCTILISVFCFLS